MNLRTPITRRNALLTLGALLGGALNPQPAAPAMGRARSMASRGGEMDFNALVLGDHVENECTPEVPADFVGIRINAPRAVKAGVDQFAVCGTFRFPADFVYKFPTIHYATVLVAVGVESQRAMTANLKPPGGTLDEEPSTPHKDPDWMEDHFVKLYFNVDLLRYMREFPEVKDDYFIYALIENHISNVVRVSFQP